MTSFTAISCICIFSDIEGHMRTMYYQLRLWEMFACLNPRTWALNASTLPLDHRSRLYTGYVCKIIVCNVTNTWSPKPEKYSIISDFIAFKKRHEVTALQVGRSRVPFPMLSLEFFIDEILPATLWPWG